MPSFAPYLPPTFHGRVDELSDSERRALADTASALKRASLAGHADQPLQGKNLGLLCEAGDSPDAALFTHAARALGAQVVHIRPSVAGIADNAALHQTARMLGRLYDAIECQGLPAALVEQIRGHAGVPVYQALAAASPATSALAHLLDSGSSEQENRAYVVQALLVGSVG